MKHRYIVAQLVAGQSTCLTSRDLQAALKSKIEELFGSMGSLFGGTTVVRYAEMDHSLLFVVRTSREAHVNVQFALCCMGKVKDAEVAVRVLRTKGSSRTCKASLKELLVRHFDLASKLAKGEKDSVWQLLDGSLAASDL